MADSYVQSRPFYPKEMGTKKGWCLQNCRLGFRIYTGKYASAKAAMNAAKRNGTYHAGTPPSNISVPVYTASPSSNGHVVVYDKGVWYTDGRKYTPAKGSIYGWDEMMDGVRVVDKTTKSFLPPKGYYAIGDKDAQYNPGKGILGPIAQEAEFMRRTFPSYTPAKALGPQYGKNLSNAIKEFQKRTNLYPDGMTGPKTYAKLQEYGFKYVPKY